MLLTVHVDLEGHDGGQESEVHEDAHLCLLIVIRVARVCLIKLEFALFVYSDQQKKIQKKESVVACKKIKIKKRKKVNCELLDCSKKSIEYYSEKFSLPIA